jgi:hypothetical protein
MATLRVIVHLRRTVAWIIAIVLVVVLKFAFPIWLIETAPPWIVLPVVFVGLGLGIVRGLAWLEREYLAPREEAQKAKGAIAGKPRDINFEVQH